MSLELHVAILAASAVPNNASVSKKGLSFSLSHLIHIVHRASYSPIVPPFHYPSLLYMSCSLLVAYAAPTLLNAPMNKHTAIAFGPSVP